MEPPASTSSDASDSDHHRRRFDPSHPQFSDRVIRAVNHRLRLLHRADSVFFVLGSTGNVYTVTLSAAPSCTCPDRATPCKHILFVFIKVLGVPIDDSALWRRSLRECQVNRFLNLPTSSESLASAAVRERFHQMYLQWRVRYSGRPSKMGDGNMGCPVCLEVMRREEKIVECGICKNSLHEDCFLKWRRSCRRGSATCVLCRARWRSGGDEQDKYLNLGAFVGEDTGELNQECTVIDL